VRKLFWIVPIGAIAAVGAFLFSTDGLLRRDLACEDMSAGRAQKLCRALAKNMDWTWTGHSILSPSFRVTISGTRRTLCQQPVTPDDTLALIEIFLSTQSRFGMAAAQLNNGSRFLLNMLGDGALAQFPMLGDGRDDREQLAKGHLRDEIAQAISSPANIFNPLHANFVLRGGCTGYDTAE
jgi:hypothetical protein